MFNLKSNIILEVQDSQTMTDLAENVALCTSDSARLQNFLSRSSSTLLYTTTSVSSKQTDTKFVTKMAAIIECRRKNG
jgi:hypothetical protein